MTDRRVVFTGLGLVSPLGLKTDEVWRRLVAGESGVRAIDLFDASDLTCRVAGQVPQGSYAENGLDLDAWLDPKERRKTDRFIQLAIVAAELAIADAGWHPQTLQGCEETGVLIGSGIGGLESIVQATDVMNERGPRRLYPFFVPSCLINLAAGQVSIRHGFRGPNHAIVTACATGSHAIGDAARMIRFGDAEVMVAGGAESPVCRLGVAGFCASRALSTGFNDTPEAASRPWDRHRDGFVAGEGAAIVVLEAYEHAKRRGARIYGELLGYGMSGDAHHVTAPAPDGSGGYRAMHQALRSARLPPDAIDYINAHGTSTPVGDDIELQAVERLFGAHCSKLAMSSTKSSVGHLLGAAGALEAIFSILSIYHKAIPPTINLHEPSLESPIDRVPHQGRDQDVKTVLSNSFGFGGTNASLVFGELR